MTREANGRFEQISDWSMGKHAFFSINANACGQCFENNGNILGPNCSDTYGAGLNSGRTGLGPPEEIDPWLGVWQPVGSYFDRGDPDVGAPQNTDGRKSLNGSMVNNFDGVKNRVEVDDADLNDPTATYYYGSYVVILGEPGSNRTNNGVSRQCNPNWSGNSWNFNDTTNPINGTILEQWNGARLDSGENGSGQFFVGVKVTGPDNRGMWHYEYAVNNLDNSRGGASFRLPTCTAATVENAVFQDIDGNVSNDWSVTITNGAIDFIAPAGNALEWNTIYNFAFDSNAAPLNGAVDIDHARMGAGGLTVSVATEVPGMVFNPITGPGCGVNPPRLSPSGTPPMATIPNPNFEVLIDQMAPNSIGFLFSALGGSSTPLGNGCVQRIELATATTIGLFSADGNGVVSVPLAIPNDVSLEGLDLHWQLAEVVAAGPAFGMFELSNGLAVRVGNNRTNCP